MLTLPKGSPTKPQAADSVYAWTDRINYRVLLKIELIWVYFWSHLTVFLEHTQIPCFKDLKNIKCMSGIWGVGSCREDANTYSQNINNNYPNQNFHGSSLSQNYVLNLHEFH